MKLISKGPWVEVNQFGVKRQRPVVYRARFLEHNSQGIGVRHVEHDCEDVYNERPDGQWFFSNTAKNVSYIGELRKAVR